MYKKNFVLLLLAALASIPVFAGDHEIAIRKEGTYTGSRTIEM